MATITCREFSTQLDAWMEGDRSATAEAHIRGCRSCQSLIADLDTIQSTARSWDAAEVDPPARIWSSLRLRLEEEGLIHDVAIATPVFQPAASNGLPPSQPATPSEHSASWLDKLLAGMARPALAGAYMAALIAIGFALSGPGSQRGSDDHWTELTQDTTTPLSSQLDTVERTVFVRESDPVVTASLHKNLAIVDNYIVLCEKSVREEPGNEIARDYLYGAYQQKADLLAHMTEDGDGR